MPPITGAIAKNIIIPSLTSLLGKLNEKNCISISISYSLTGGSFTIQVLENVASALPENAQITLPNGRIGIIKSTGRSLSSGGLVDTFAGTALPLAATLNSFVGIASNQFRSLSSLAVQLGVPVSWQTLDLLVRGFVFRGNALAGVQQLASVVSGEVVVRNNEIIVTDPGKVVGNKFNVTKPQIVSASQTIDYSLDVKSVLNPALTTAQNIPDGVFMYDDQHAQKQPKFTVQTGAPGSAASTDFIPIPDGWLVDGNYEEWQPNDPNDFTNPNASVLNGRYWKIYRSPVNPLMLRGITNFTRLIKQINLPTNISTFVGSPVTGETLPDTPNTLIFDNPGTESGIYGFNAGVNTGLNPVGYSFFDIISHQFYNYPTAICLVPVGGGGDPANSFYSITMEVWTFPKVNPQVFPKGNPGNPFNLPSDVVIVNPSSIVALFSVNDLTNYWAKYLQNYRLINSPRLKTQVSVIYTGTLPQVGDQLLLDSGIVGQPNCGRISQVALNFNRSGVVINISAESFQYGPGLYTLTN